MISVKAKKNIKTKVEETKQLYRIEMSPSIEELINHEEYNNSFSVSNLISIREDSAEGDGFSIEFDITHTEKKSTLYQPYLQVYDCRITCGMLEIDNFSSFETIFRNHRNPENKRQLIELVSCTLDKLFKRLKLKGKFAFILASNNNKTPIINGILEKLALSSTEWTRNPNSSSQIKAWVL